LRLLRFQLPSTQTAKVAILITDAIHGDEYLGAALKVAELLATRGSQLPQFRDFMEAGGRVYVVPIVNPDGFAAGTRENANRQDLNRDFPDQVHNVGGLEQPETKNLVNYLSQDLQGTKLIMSLDYHCCQSTLIYPPGRGFSVSQAAQQQFRTLGAIVQKLFGYAHGSITQLIPYPAPGAAGDYLHKHFGSLALGFEGSGSNETQKYETHLQMWESYFAWAAAQIR
jgi:murein tripeptide amidase MpaA